MLPGVLRRSTCLEVMCLVTGETVTWTPVLSWLLDDITFITIIGSCSKF